MTIARRLPRILVTGKHGQVGGELLRALAPLGTVRGVGREDVELTDRDALRAMFRELQPDLVVNAAAYTAVDVAEREPEIAQRVNAAMPGMLAEEARRRGIPLLHYSTDYVFDGTKGSPYTEEDAPNPLNVYGRSKLAGEANILASGARHLILRLAWVYGARGTNFPRTLRQRAREGGALRIVDDQYGAPTWCRLIAEATARIVRAQFAAEARWEGIYHLTAAGAASWHRFARTILAADADAASRITPISTADYPTPARRPAATLLSNAKVHARFGVRLPDWETQWRLFVEEQG